MLVILQNWFGPNCLSEVVKFSMTKRIKIEENKTQENDGFSSSDGEFEREVGKMYSLTRRVELLRKQITREKKEHATEIAEKVEDIRNLQAEVLKQEKKNILTEERNLKLEQQLKEPRESYHLLQDKEQELQDKEQQLKDNEQQLQDKEQQLEDKEHQLEDKKQQLEDKEEQLQDKEQQLQDKEQLLEDKEQQLQYKEGQLEDKEKQLQDKEEQLQGKEHQLQDKEQQLQDKEQQLEDKEQQLQDKEQQLQDKEQQLQDKEQQLEHKEQQLQAETLPPPDITDVFGGYNQTQMASQVAYGNLERNSTRKFNDKHVVPQHSAAERHAYAKNYRFWNFDEGNIEHTIKSLNDTNFKNVSQLLGMTAQDRVTQIFQTGRFRDSNGRNNGPTSVITTVILSKQKQLAIDFQRKPNTMDKVMIMRVRRMSPEEIKQNNHGLNNHFQGPTKS